MPDVSSYAKPARFRLAIVGGGIAGLTLAVAIGKFEDCGSPIDVDLYEAGPEITTVGAGISVWPRTWAIMRQLGLYDELLAASVQAASDGDKGKAEESGADKDELKPAFVFRKSDWLHEGYEFARVMVPNGSTTMHRADMVDVLVRHLPPSCQVHTSKRLVKYTENRRENGCAVYTLHFADGTTAEADAVIGADGIKSRTRTAMYEYAHRRDCCRDLKREDCERCSKATPKWTGTVGYRYLIPTERMHARNPEHSALKIKSPMSYSGKGKHIITYPISHGKYLNWIGFVTIPGGEGTVYPHRWVTEAHQAEVVANYAGWEYEVGEMVELVEKPTLWAIHVIENLPFSVSGAVALMGDAVHAMTTHFGAGGGQAIEDAYILGRLLADPRTSLARIPEVFKIYQDVRLPFARKVVNNARKAGLMYEFDWPGLYDGSPVAAKAVETEQEARGVERVALAELGEAVQELWQWQWKERVEDQWEDASKRYEQLIKADGENKGWGAKVLRLLTSCVVM